MMMMIQLCILCFADHTSKPETILEQGRRLSSSVKKWS